MVMTSAVPGAIDALLDLLRADAALDQVDILDGPPLDWDSMKPAEPQRGDGSRWLVIGAQPGDDNLTAEAVQEWGATGTGTNAHSRDETFGIYCTAVAFDGGQSTKAARDLAFAMVARVEELLRADPSISGSVLYSAFGGVTALHQTHHEKGLTVDALFNVQARAYLTS